MSRKRHSQDNRADHSYPPHSGAHSTNDSRYLRPDDMYNMDPDVSYFGTSISSHSSSRHGSDTYSPYHGNISSTGYSQMAYTQPSDPFQQYQYADASRHVSSAGSPYASRRLSPADEAATFSRPSPQSGNFRRVSPNFDSKSTQHGSDACVKGKGKQKEVDSQASARKQSGGSRHGSGDKGGSRSGSASAGSEKLVSGVFIRY